MTDFYIAQPEVAGGWGPNTVFTRTPGKRVAVHKLHYELQGWLGDELLTSKGELIATDRMAREIERAKLTGIEFDEVEITVSDEFVQVFPDLQLPKFVWLQVGGTPGRDDFGIEPRLLRLVVSERALEVLRRVGIPHARVSSFEQGGMKTG